MTYLGGAGISALSDPATVVLAHGMVDVVRAGKAMLTDGVLRGKVLTDAAGANLRLMCQWHKHSCVFLMIHCNSIA